MQTDKSKIHKRLEVLANALYNDSTEKDVGRLGFLIDGERIMINQERGYLFSLLTYCQELTPVPLREYQISESIEKKITLNT